MDTFGRKYKVSIFGESHGPAIGVVLDGVPAGIPISEQDFMPDIDRRRSGAPGTTPRKEADMPEILSGVYEGHTTGAPLAVIFRNGNTRSQDYSLFKKIPRPGHADFVADVKWSGLNDPRGGGHFSGRITLSVVAAGTLAKKILGTGVEVTARLVEIGGVTIHEAEKRAGASNGEYDSQDASVLWRQELEDAASQGDSLGGVVECVVRGLPVGVGEPFFDSVESMISHAVFSIPGVRGIEFGDGFSSARMRGSQHNDPFVSPDGKCASNGAGGINGGITNGNPVVFRVAFKPTSSIRKAQNTLNFATGETASLEVPGRHDVCFALRTPVVVEAAAAIAIADLELIAAADRWTATADKR